MKLILASAITLIGLSQAKLEINTNDRAKEFRRWRFGGKCVELKDTKNNRRFNSLFLKDCNEKSSGSDTQRFFFEGEKILNSDRTRCLHFNPDTKIYAMALIDSEKFCVKADENTNRFVHNGSGKMRLKGDSSNCILPQKFINKKYNKIVNGPGCPTITKDDIKEFADKNTEKHTNDGQLTYANAIYNAISRSGAAGNTKGNVKSSVEAVFGDKFVDGVFENHWKKMVKINTIKETSKNSGRFVNTTEKCKGKGPNGKCEKKGKTNYPKLIFTALKTSSNSWKSNDDVHKAIEAANSGIKLNKKKVDQVLKKKVTLAKSNLEKDSSGRFRLKDAACDKGLTGLCDNSKNSK